MKLAIIKFLFLIITVNLVVKNSFGQDKFPEKFNLYYLASDYTDDSNKKSVIVILAVTPIKSKDFPPVLSMKFTYKINNDGSWTTIDLQKQIDKKVSLLILGSSVKEKSPEIYELIKNKIDLISVPDIMLLAFKLDSVSEDDINNLAIKYGLWEKRNQNIRVEKTFNFNIQE